MNEYKTGDKVRLRSGGPQMTVAGIAADKENAPCAWFAGLELKIAHFPLLTLESSPERQPEGNTEVLGDHCTPAKLLAALLDRAAITELIAALQAMQQTLAAYLSDDHITMSDKLCQSLELQARQALLKAGVKL